MILRLLSKVQLPFVRHLKTAAIKLPPLKESDLLESFIRGNGAGGQAVQKTSNCCSLIHLPTGVRVVCHETRSQERNRMLARRRLQEKLDMIQNPGSSKIEKEWEKLSQKKAAKRRKGKRKEKLLSEGEKEGDESNVVL